MKKRFTILVILFVCLASCTQLVQGQGFVPPTTKPVVPKQRKTPGNTPTPTAENSKGIEANSSSSEGIEERIELSDDYSPPAPRYEETISGESVVRPYDMVLYEQHMLDGREKKQQGQEGDAERAFKMALEYKPEDPEATKELLEIWSRRDAATLSRISNETQNTYMALMLQGDSLYRNLQFNAAIAKYKEVLEVKPGDIYALQNMKDCENHAGYRELLSEGERLLESQSWEEAIKLFTRISGLHPNESSAIIYLDMCQQNLKMYQDRVAKAEDFLDMEEYELAYGAFSAAMKMYPQAAETIRPRRKIAEDKYMERIEYRAQEAIQRFDDWARARELYKTALDVLPDNEYVKSQIKKCTEEMRKIEALRKEAETNEKN